MFCGDIRFVYTEDKLMVDTNMYSDYVLSYDSMDTVEFREGNVPGLRVGGFGSFRLLMGFFENDEFGTYTRYTYTNADSGIVITVGEKILVISGKDPAETQAIYQSLVERTGK